MHIPQSNTQSLSILSFEESRLEAAGRDRPDYDRDAWLYIPDHYEEYRYILGTRGQRPLICLGVNPSTAAPGALDNTLKSVERIAHHNGFDSFVMLNVYAQRATRPNDMDRTCNECLHGENLQAFRYVLAQSASPPCVWAAWGAVIEKRPYLFHCVWDMIETGRSFGARWVKAGALSKAGHPHHPLYLRSDTPVEDFDIESYVVNQQKRFTSL
ncbi:MAG TPA: DUF1643 domain-containing protein [Firmicutes bacterium]|nr:DUF1643 domain-containing protein [Bacillota bacterium]